ncbi:MBL fold metallo-hydrolase [Pseudonocardia nigra]|uniref:MBL fold metallo-hydrolase n=1 Tax=Pseudonocardia nigra TaxID=1921578 RepID=UPI001C5E37E2|nr:MBL fold metallo-hydrolase [Pseudonocardia nigra]
MTAAAAEWTEPGAFAVAPGIHRIPLPLPTDGLRAVNVYAIEDGDALVLVDSGWALEESRAALSSALRVLGCGLGDVRRFLVTHIHRDHYTQAVTVRRDFGARVSVGLGEKPALDALVSGVANLEPQLVELRASGAAELAEQLGAFDPESGERMIWEGPDDWLTEQPEIELATRTLRVLPTPGHTQGHVVFADSDAGLLFAGDHVLPHITPSIGFEPFPGELPLGDYLQSLRVVRGLPDMRLLPAHGPVAGSSHDRIDELLAHHRARLLRSEEAVVKGASTAHDVARCLRWTRRERQLSELDPFNQMLAVIETRAHLELLAAQGRLRSSVVAGVVHYEQGLAPASIP